MILGDWLPMPNGILGNTGAPLQMQEPGCYFNVTQGLAGDLFGRFEQNSVPYAGLALEIHPCTLTPAGLCLADAYFKTLALNSTQECCAECTKTPNCTAFTLNKDEGQCYLKNALGNPREGEPGRDPRSCASLIYLFFRHSLSQPSLQHPCTRAVRLGPADYAAALQRA